MTRSPVNDYRPSVQVSSVLQGTPFGELLAGRTAEDRKREGMARAYASSEDWRREATPLLRSYLLSLPDGAIITAYEIRNKADIPQLPKERSRVWWGPFIQAAARWGWYSKVGVAISQEGRGHGNEIDQWRVNRAAVERGVPEKQED